MRLRIGNVAYWHFSVIPMSARCPLLKVYEILTANIRGLLPFRGGVL